MFVVRCLLVLFHVGLTLAFVNDWNCSSLCGTPFKAKAHSELSVNITVNFDGECVRDSTLSTGKWEQSARRFMQYINMNDTAFDCPKWNVVYHGHNTGEMLRPRYLPYFRVFHNGKNSSYYPNYWARIDDPAGIPGSCSVEVDHGVVDNNYGLYFMAAESQCGGNSLARTGSLISLWDASQLKRDSKIDPLQVHVQQNKSNDCRVDNCTAYEMMWLPASTFGTTVPCSERYSIFAKWNYKQIPGIDKLLDKFRISVSDYENATGDLSYSNIAILCLPLLMAIPPISLLENVSNLTTAWYVLATDILAALPLLIEGIEMVNNYPSTTAEMFSTLSLTGKKYGVYERWHIQCKPRDGTAKAVGYVIFGVALWFMMASSYSEFAFWRALQYRTGRLNIRCVNSLSDPDEEYDEVERSNSQDSKTRNNLWYARFRIHILAGGFLILIAALIYAIIISSQILDVSIAIGLVVFRVIGTNRFQQLLRWRFFIGLILGFVAGPLYLMLQLSKNIRKSNSWSDVSDGATLGMAVLGLTSAQLLGLTSEPWFPIRISSLTLFAWIYGGGIIVLHAIRSLPSDRVKWRYGLNGFATGIVFGPFGIFFKRCFPETMVDQQARANFLGGFSFGVFFLLTAINFAVQITLYIETAYLLYY